MNASEGGQASGDVDINIAPIIDCFTVLITFLLASASFLSIGILEAYTAPAPAKQGGGEPAPAEIFLRVSADGGLSITTVAKEGKRTRKLPPAGGRPDLATLERSLAELARQWPKVDAVTIEADSGSRYGDLIAAMDKARKAYRAVVVGSAL